MKIIDEKGMLFGKINLIDFLVILFLLFIMPMFYFGQKVIENENKKVIFEKPQKIIRVKATFTNVMPTLAAVVKKGDVSKDQDAKVTGNIIEIISNTPSQQIGLNNLRYDQVSKTIYIDPSTVNRDLTLLLYLSCYKERNTWYFSEFNIKIGNGIGFTTDLYSLSGVISDIID